MGDEFIDIRKNLIRGLANLAETAREQLLALQAKMERDQILKEYEVDEYTADGIYAERAIFAIMGFRVDN